MLAANAAATSVTKRHRPHSPQHCRTAVMIIHGRDELNLLRLHRLLNGQWRVPTFNLSEVSGFGATMIEKFESAAADAEFVIALLTPDDRVTFAAETYRAPRPNVLFELGWIFGRFGRDRVCVIVKRGTRLPSNLAGINRIEFKSQVGEVAG